VNNVRTQEQPVALAYGTRPDIPVPGHLFAAGRLYSSELAAVCRA